MVKVGEIQHVPLLREIAGSLLVSAERGAYSGAARMPYYRRATESHAVRS
jgi:hypothetical protein